MGFHSTAKVEPGSLLCSIFNFIFPPHHFWYLFFKKNSLFTHAPPYHLTRAFFHIFKKCSVKILNHIPFINSPSTLLCKNRGQPLPKFKCTSPFVLKKCFKKNPTSIFFFNCFYF